MKKLIDKETIMSELIQSLNNSTNSVNLENKLLNSGLFSAIVSIGDDYLVCLTYYRYNGKIYDYINSHDDMGKNNYLLNDLYHSNELCEYELKYKGKQLNYKTIITSNMLNDIDDIRYNQKGYILGSLGFIVRKNDQKIIRLLLSSYCISNKIMKRNLDQLITSSDDIYLDDIIKNNQLAIIRVSTDDSMTYVNKLHNCCGKMCYDRNFSPLYYIDRSEIVTLSYFLSEQILGFDNNDFINNMHIVESISLDIKSSGEYIGDTIKSGIIEHGETISKGMSNAAAIIGESNLESAEILGKVIKQNKFI